MKIKKLLDKLMGIHYPPPVLTQLEDLGFEDTGETEQSGTHRILKYQHFKVLYNIQKDEIIDYWEVLGKK